MAYDSLKVVTMPIGAAIAQNVFVKVNASGQVVVTGVGEDAIGVTLEGATTQQFTDGKTTVPVALISGGGKVPVRALASTAIAVGNRVASGANGELKVTAMGNIELGYALEVAGVDADQELVTVLLDKAGKATP